MWKKVGVFCLILILSVAFQVFTGDAKARAADLPYFTSETSAFSRVLVYHQNTSAQLEWQSKRLGGGTCACGQSLSYSYMGYKNVNGGNNTCPNCGASIGWGCGIYAMAHAIQWANGIAKDNNNGGNFLDEFIRVKDQPFRGNLYDNYASIVSAYGISTQSVPTSEDGLYAFFSNGGAIVTNIPGHYQCAVGIARGANGDTWIHMLDSTCYSTIHRLNDKGYNAYNFSTGAVQGGTANYGGGEYWITYQAYCNAFSKIVALTGRSSWNKYPEIPVLTITSTDGGYKTRFSWSMSRDTSYYDIHIRDKNNNVVLDDTTGKDTSYVAQLPVGSYYAYVGAVNTNADEWKATDSEHTWFAVVNHNAIPSKPELRVIETDNLHDTVLTWNATDNTEHYDVHILDSDNNIVVDTGVGVSRSFSVRLKSGNYTAYVGAVNSYADDWKWNDSDRISFTVANAYPRPGKPTLSVEAKDDTQDTVFSWTTTGNTSYYDVHICNEQGVLMSTDGVGMDTQFRKRLPAGVYWAYVGAVNTHVEDWTTNDSERVRFRVIKYGATPGKPVLNVNTVEDSNSVQFTWGEVSNTWRYDLHVRDMEGNAVLDESFYTTSIHSAILPDGTYYAYVGAVNRYAEPWIAVDSEKVYFQAGGKALKPVSLTVTPSDELLSIMTIKNYDELEAQTAYYAGHIREHLTVEVTFNDGTIQTVDGYDVTTWIEYDENVPQRYRYNYTVTYGNLMDLSEIIITLKSAPVYGAPDFILPSVITAVDDSAFEGIAATVVYIPDTCTGIGDWAFRDCPNLTQIRIPADCLIGMDAFEGCSDIVIFGAPGSPAEAYAGSHDNCTFVAE